MQHSFEEFWRSVLLHTLRQCPELIEKIFLVDSNDKNNIFDEVEYQFSEFYDVFFKLIRLWDLDDYRFCYFIDGLDEYKGDNIDHQTLATQITDWSKSPSVKIVCSSRPYTVFLETFKETGITIELGGLTGNDISEFATAQFKKELSKPEYHEAQEECLNLVEDIVGKSEGVFL